MSAHELVAFLALAVALFGLFIVLLASNDRLRRERDAARQDTARLAKLEQAIRSSDTGILMRSNLVEIDDANAWLKGSGSTLAEAIDDLKEARDG